MKISSVELMELTVQGTGLSRVLKGSTRHKLAPGAELTVQGADRSKTLEGSTRHRLAPGAEVTVRRVCQLLRTGNSASGANLWRVEPLQRLLTVSAFEPSAPRLAQTYGVMNPSTPPIFQLLLTANSAPGANL